jgi:hypothetical protein
MTDNGGADQFLDTIEAALADPHPLPLLLMASAIVATLDPEHHSTAAFVSGHRREASIGLTEFCESLLNAGEKRSLALAAVIAEITGNGVLSARTQRETLALNEPLPEWIRRLDQTRVTGVIAMTDMLGDGQNIVVEASLPDHVLSAVVYVDHNMGTVVKDGFFLPASLNQVKAAWRRAEDQRANLRSDSDVTELSQADARARLVEAIDAGHRFGEPIETENWPACGPLVMWLLDMMPEGGTGYPFVEEDSDEISEQQYWAYQLEALADEVGGAEALKTVDIAPLPNEPFDWSGIPQDIAPRVNEVLGLVDVAVPALFGGSHRSDGKPTDYSVDELGVACRRFLVRVASADPPMFRRKGAAKAFAAAVVWIVGKANNVVGQYSVQSKDVQAHFDVGSVTQRAEPMLAAVGANRRYNEMGLGDAAFLTSATRRSIIASRDAALATISALAAADSNA